MEHVYREQIEAIRNENRILQEQLEKEEERKLRDGRNLLNKLREARLPVEILDALSKVYTEYNELKGNLYDVCSVKNAQKVITETMTQDAFKKTTDCVYTEGWCNKIQQLSQASGVMPTETNYSLIGFIGFGVSTVVAAASALGSNCKNSVRIRIDKELELAENVLQHLDQSFDRISPLAEASEELDKVLRKRFGFTLYSREFPELCEIIPNVIVSSEGFSGVEISENLKKFVTSLESYYQKNIIQVCNDVSLKSKFSELSKIVSNSEFIKVNALYQASRIIKLFPCIFSGKEDEFSLNCVRQAYCIINLLSVNSSNIDLIKESITSLKKNYDQMKEMRKDSIDEMQ